jgi:hypothetical protein
VIQKAAVEATRIAGHQLSAAYAPTTPRKALFDRPFPSPLQNRFHGFIWRLVSRQLGCFVDHENLILGTYRRWRFGR